MKYAGITIGPIFDTIMDAVSPAALWFSSTFFSDLTRRICIKVEKVFSGEGFELISPYLDEMDVKGLKDGVGKYHDRIFFRAESIQVSELDEIMNAAKGEMTQVFGSYFFKETGMSEKAAKTFLYTYLQIHYIILDEKQIGSSNCILVLSPYLDALELMKSFPATNRDDPMRRMMLGKENGRNILVRNSNLYESVDKCKNPLNSPDNDIWKIEEIAKGKQTECNMQDKYLKYYAVVSADADSMGTFLRGIPQEKTSLFSKRCLAYDKAAADIINQYGGMVIYAGGDDLLFLAPVRKSDQEKESTIFDLCKKISQKFQELIQGSEGEEQFEQDLIPTISFGVSIQYHKFPLYEALNRSRDCLESAKKIEFRVDNDNIEKNCIYCRLERHSGKCEDILIGNEVLDEYINLLNEMLEMGDESQGGINEKMVKSLGTKLYECRDIIYVMDDKYQKKLLTKAKPLWDNLFDGEGQEGGRKFREYVEQWYYDNLVDRKRRVITQSKDKHDEKKQDEQDDQKLQTLIAVLSINKFFLEKGGDGQ